MIGIILDIIVVAIIILNIYLCYRKGLVRLAVGLVAVLVSIILALILYKPVSNLVIEHTQIDENIEKTIIKNFTVKTSEDGEEENGEVEGNEATSENNEENEDKDSSFMKYMEKYVDDAINKTRNEIVIEASEVIAVKVINVCVIIAIFIIARIALILLTFITDIITSLPIIKQFNEVGGILYGAIKAFLIIYVILAIVFFIINITGNTGMSEAIESTFITKFFYNHNILLNLIF